VSAPRLAPLALLLLPALASGCRARSSLAAELPPTTPADAAAPTTDWVDPSPHLARSVELAGVHLATLDWGGAGPALVLVHGLGGNPHVFDDLAPLLRAHFHVLAFAVRGQGDSDAPPKGPYDLDSVVADLGRLLDSLKIERAHLLAWSTAGAHITRFAAVAPARVGKLVYLDAAYDWSDPTFLSELKKMVTANAADLTDLVSLDAYRDWFEETWLGRQAWTPGLEAFLRDRVRVSGDGHVALRTPALVQRQLFAGLSGPPPAYARLQAPALALYASTFFPVDSPNPGRAFLARDFEDRVAAPWRARSLARARRELGSIIVRRLDGATHTSIGVRDVAALAATIDEFLTGAPRAAAP
jgi:pimeloyl-ACP methyl ester carboxylesterase